MSVPRSVALERITYTLAAPVLAAAPNLSPDSAVNTGVLLAGAAGIGGALLAVKSGEGTGRKLVRLSPVVLGATIDVCPRRTPKSSQKAAKAYQGAGLAIRVPYRGKPPRGWRRRHNRDHAKIRSLGEHAMAILKSWRLLRKLRCSTTRITAVVRAVVALELAT
ncbi:transposase family protein [Streptomyces sp. NPDC053741]|uniref:transposase family protein n=1 Tax=Streptomyces sp. NPDC053741 TaxID=3156684 RepID=UPI003418B28A